MAQGDGITVRGLERGLDVIRAIERCGAATATLLHRETKLPKPTLTRLLRTLEQKGFAWRSISDGCYRLCQQRHGAATMPQAGHVLAAVAGPVLDELCEIVRWPSDVSVRNRTYMQLCETSRSRAYFTLNRLQIGYRINMMLSAPGRAYLAWCPERERTSILRRLELNAGGGDAMPTRAGELERLLAQTRAQGYAVRDANWGGDYRKTRAEYDDGLGAIAVPIISRGRVLGCVNIVWIARILRAEAVAAAYAENLRGAAARIARLAEANAAI